MADQLSVHVIVLGDLLRSPRILSHAHCLSREGWQVTVSGYGVKQMDVALSPIQVLCIPECPNFRKCYLPNIFTFLLKFVFTACILALHLIMHCRSRVILIQNPPAVPTFLVVWLFIRCTGKSLVVDWHNYGYTIMGLNVSKNSLLTRLYYSLEVSFASHYLCTPTNKIAHLCVSKAFQRDLALSRIKATVLYDRPPDYFCSTKAYEAHNLFMKLSKKYLELGDPKDPFRSTRFTVVKPEFNLSLEPEWRLDRPALVVTSCSWSMDDDFDMMIRALDLYDERANERIKLPHVVFAVTGRGPMKEHYAHIVKNRNWRHVEVIMPWLDWADYPTFLGCADLGISLHRSSSGLDLPMKVVDLLGVNVPVLALTYPTLNELLPNNKCGLHFETYEQLADQLCLLLCSRTITTVDTDNLNRYVSIGSDKLKALRNSLIQNNSKSSKGYKYWQQKALPVFRKVVKAKIE